MPGISRWSPGILPVYGHFHNCFHYIRKKLIPLSLKSQGDFLYISVRSDLHLLRLPNSKVSYW